MLADLMSDEITPSHRVLQIAMPVHQIGDQPQPWRGRRGFVQAGDEVIRRKRHSCRFDGTLQMFAAQMPGFPVFQIEGTRHQERRAAQTAQQRRRIADRLIDIAPVRIDGDELIRPEVGAMRWQARVTL